MTPDETIALVKQLGRNGDLRKRSTGGLVSALYANEAAVSAFLGENVSLSRISYFDPGYDYTDHTHLVTLSELRTACGGTQGLWTATRDIDPLPRKEKAGQRSNSDGSFRAPR